MAPAEDDVEAEQEVRIDEEDVDEPRHAHDPAQPTKQQLADH